MEILSDDDEPCIVGTTAPAAAVAPSSSSTNVAEPSGKTGVSNGANGAIHLDIDVDEAASSAQASRELEEDSGRLPKDSEASFPPLPPRLPETTHAVREVLAQKRQEAAEALAEGNLEQALDKYSEAIQTGCATALILAGRGELLLRMTRPSAAVRDCSAAIELNADCGKAYRIRGLAHRALGHWKKAHRDLSQGQGLDYDETALAAQKFVNAKMGLIQDLKTGRWHKMEASGGGTLLEGAHKAAELINGPSAKRVAATNVTAKPAADFQSGQAAEVNFLDKAPHLNGKRVVILRPDAKSSGRWEVEFRLDGGKLEVKSIRAENIQPVKAADAEDWKEEERIHKEQRLELDREERRQKLEQQEEERRKKAEVERRAKRQRDEAKLREMEKRIKLGEVPDLEPSEQLEAEMSGLPLLDEETMELLRGLDADEALNILSEAPAVQLCDFIQMRVKDFHTNQDDGGALIEEDPMEDGAEDVEEPEDPERLPEEMEPLPPIPSRRSLELSEADAEVLTKSKAEAAEALARGELKKALAKYTEAIETGGASALIFAKRAELLLRLKRPCATIRDCSAAIDINPDCGKAYLIRGTARRTLGQWRAALQDLSEGQRLDYDESSAGTQSFVSERVKADEERAARALRRSARGGNPTKRAKI